MKRNSRYLLAKMCMCRYTSKCFDWVKNTLTPVAKNLGEFILFCDNLTTQTSEQFLSEVHELNGIVWFGVKDATDIWQPVDNGYGALYKRLISQIQDE